MPALRLDAAVVHVNRADAAGSGQILGPDPFFDELFLGAADRRFVTTERVVPTDELAAGGPLQTLCISRLLTDGVIETPGGAHFTACVPDYGRDEGFQKEYVAAAGDPDGVGRLPPTGSSPSTRTATRRPPARPPTSGPRPGPPRRAHDRVHPHRGHPGRVLRHRLRRGVPRRRRGDGERLRHRARARRPPGPAHLRPRPRPDRRRRRARRRRAAARGAHRRRSCSSRTCPTAGSSTSCGRAGAT